MLKFLHDLLPKFCTNKIYNSKNNKIKFEPIYITISCILCVAWFPNYRNLFPLTEVT